MTYSKTTDSLVRTVSAEIVHCNSVTYPVTDSPIRGKTVKINSFQDLVRASQFKKRGVRKGTEGAQRINFALPPVLSERMQRCMSDYGVKTHTSFVVSAVELMLDKLGY